MRHVALLLVVLLLGVGAAPGRAEEPSGEAGRPAGAVDFRAEILQRPDAHAPIPPSVSFRGHPFLRVVEEAWSRRWLDDPAEIVLARRAVERMREHVHRLEHDAAYRAGDQALANLHLDPALRGFELVAAFDAPYLVCYAWPTGPEGPPDAWAAMRRQARWAGALEQELHVLQVGYEAFLQRYGSTHELRRLEAPWGGRPDLPLGRRSYEDGVVLPVVLLADRSDYEALARESGGAGSLARGLWAHGDAHVDLGAGAGRLVLTRAERLPLDDDAALRRRLHFGAHQLLHWFTRQRNAWSSPKLDLGFFREGFASIHEAASVGDDGRVVLLDRNPHVLRQMQATAAALRQRGGAYAAYPLALLVHPRQPAEIINHGVQAWEIPASVALQIYHQQAWALAAFLRERHPQAFARLLEGHLARDNGLGQNRLLFEKALGLAGPEDLAALDEAWRAFVADLLD